jgi:hypothetical protein
VSAVQRVAGTPVRGVAFLLLYFLYVWQVLDSSLLGQAQEPVFYQGADLFREQVGRPGGAAGYLAAFLWQGVHFPWLGALLLAALAAATCLLTRAFLQAMGWERPDPVWYAPGLAQLAVYSGYRAPINSDVALLLALLALLGYLRVTSRLGPGIRLLVFLALSAVLYPIVGGPFLLFAVLCAVFEAGRRGRWLLGGAFLLVGAAYPYLTATFLSATMLAYAYGYQLFWPGRAVPWPLGTGYCLFFVLAAGWAVRSPSAAPRPASTRFLARLGDRFLAGRGGRWALQSLLLAVVAGGTAWASFDGNQRALLRIEAHAGRREWREILDEVNALHAYNRSAVLAIQRALYHGGQLGERLFAYPLIPGGPVFVPTPEVTADLDALADLLLDLGQVSIAEHLLSEVHEILGDRPSVLWRLASINVLKGRPEAADVFLGLLERSPLHRSRARARRQALAADPLLSNDPEIGRVRSQMVTTEWAGYFDAEALLQQLLAGNPANRMAFEYLMAEYLLTGQLDRLAAQLERLGDSGMAALPRTYEEAALLYYVDLRKALGRSPGTSFLGGRQLRPATLRRFAEFGRLFSRARTDRAAAQELEARFGDTYWYYYFFRGPGQAQWTGGAATAVAP